MDQGKIFCFDKTTRDITEVAIFRAIEDLLKAENVLGHNIGPGPSRLDVSFALTGGAMLQSKTHAYCITQTPFANFAPPVIDMQQMIDAGLNAFGLQLFAESVAGKTDAKTFKPFAFIFRNIKVTLEPLGDVDTSHH
jgi:hypothetical protein